MHETLLQDARWLDLMPLRLAGADAIGARLALPAELAARWRSALTGDRLRAGATLAACTLAVALARHGDNLRLCLAAVLPAGEHQKAAILRLQPEPADTLRTLFARTGHQLSINLAPCPPELPPGVDAVLTMDDGTLALPALAARGPVFAIEDTADGTVLSVTLPAHADALPYLQQFLRHWRAVTAALLAAPGLAVDELPLPATAAQLPTTPPPPVHRDLGSAVAARAALQPDAIALVHGGVAMTYRELDRLSSGFAGHLAGLGLRHEERVAIGGAKGAWAIVAMLGTLKAGGAHVPLGSTATPARWLEVLAQAAVRVVVAPADVIEQVGYDTLAGAAGREIVSAGDLPYLAGRAPGAHAVARGGDALAYVMYTSGSTGRPKGVACTHASVLRLCDWFAQRYPVASHPRTLQLTEFDFDPSVEQVFGTLIAGGCLVLASATDLQADAAAVLAVHEVAIANATPQILGSLLAVPGRIGALRTVISGGDALAPALVDKLLQRGYELHNHYGPTEATVDACAWRARAGAPVAVGTAIAGAVVRVLDAQSRECPPGVAGELHVGGPGLARGYLAQPALTAQAFVPDPFAAGQRLFRTGDRALRNLEGEIEILGRLQRELKIAGARVDPAALEHAALQLPGVRAAAVVVDGVASGAPSLRLAIERDDDGIAPEAVRARLATVLPPHLLPARVFALPRLPVDANGKLDRRALGAAEEASRALAPAAPRTDFERDLLALWHEVLGPRPAGIDDDFLALGGNSLQAARVVFRIYESFGVNMPLSQFFACGNVARCTAWIEDSLLAQADDATPLSTARPETAQAAQP